MRYLADLSSFETIALGDLVLGGFAVTVLAAALVGVRYLAAEMASSSASKPLVPVPVRVPRPRRRTHAQRGPH